MKDKLKLTVKMLYKLVRTIKITVTFKTPFIDISFAPSIIPASIRGLFFYPFRAVRRRSIKSSCGFAPLYSVEQFSLTI